GVHGSGAQRSHLANLDVVKVAVNQEYVPFTHPVVAGDEVALFPPVTGG
ncbi:MAG: MoaD/ThiS family protein, partial [Niveispirillum sp.]|nr:MoaD/ThiS family protein [Niveispirillum sp.]